MSSAPSVRRSCFSSQVPAASTTSVPPISSRSTSGENSARSRAEPIDAETPASPSRRKRRSSASSAPYARTSAALERLSSATALRLPLRRRFSRDSWRRRRESAREASQNAGATTNESSAKQQQEPLGNGGGEIPADESYGSARDGEAEVREREWSERVKIARDEHAVDEGLEEPDRGGLDCGRNEAGREHNRRGAQEWPQVRPEPAHDDEEGRRRRRRFFRRAQGAACIGHDRLRRRHEDGRSASVRPCLTSCSRSACVCATCGTCA